MKKIASRIWNAIKVRIIAPFRHNYLLKDKKILVYLGVHAGSGLDELLPLHSHCYGFEANPELYTRLVKKYKKYKNIHIIHAAVTDYNGVISFNISSNNGASSSVGDFKKGWIDSIKMVRTIEVPAIRLSDFLKEHNINFVDTYCSDIQGSDLTVLKTLEPLLKGKKIGSITCETAKDNYKNIYELGDNSESGFKALLSENYYLAAKGWGILKDGEFFEVYESWWEMDCKWNLKPDPKAN
ncbi:FkbM family methyltransferase [Flavobacterium saccharophilum]|uniref:Methyltransferase, FkbM family n=1 Tax=Flavobacterium saccharophilum TaxID=29534 RepID=A0A1M7K707_9FLAO|nr:FkbM family methyltransferase [Flavobacterium saccharophilum]SHM61036.1 methyltransferase, FkbM family [Flavobacterium saccharophilum]